MRRTTSSVLVSGLILSACFFTVPAAQADDDGSTLNLEIVDSKPVLKDSGGTLVALQLDNGSDPAQLEYSGTTSAGEAVTVELLKTLPTTGLELADPPTLPAEAMQLANGGGEEHVVEEHFVPQQIQSSDLVPLIATATTAKHVIIAPPRDVKIDSVDISAGSDANVTLTDKNGAVVTGLAPEESSEVSLTVVQNGVESTTVVPVQTLATTSSSSSYAATTRFRYRTFIPDAKVPAGFCPGGGLLFGELGDSFKGDNRSWKPPAGDGILRGRTLMSFVIGWGTGGVSTTKSVSPTVQYKSDGSVRRTATASSAGMYFHGIYGTSNYKRVRMHHAAGNPLCWAAGPISYSLIVDTFRNGTTHLVGSRVKAPAHEFYAKRNSAYWTILGRYGNHGLHCLSAPCGTEAMRNQKTIL